MNRGRLLGNYSNEPHSRGLFFGGASRKSHLFGTSLKRRAGLGRRRKPVRKTVARRPVVRKTAVKRAPRKGLTAKGRRRRRPPPVKADSSLLSGLSQQAKKTVKGVQRTLKKEATRTLKRGAQQLGQEAVHQLGKTTKSAIKQGRKSTLGAIAEVVGSSRPVTAAPRRKLVARRRMAASRIVPHAVKTVIGGAPLF